MAAATTPKRSAAAAADDKPRTLTRDEKDGEDEPVAQMKQKKQKEEKEKEDASDNDDEKEEEEDETRKQAEVSTEFGMLVISTHVTYKFAPYGDGGSALNEAIGGSIEGIANGKRALFRAYCDEECFYKEVGSNDLAAYVMSVLDIRTDTFMTGVRGTIVIIGQTKDGTNTRKLTVKEATALRDLCDDIIQSDGGFSEKKLRRKYPSLLKPKRQRGIKSTTVTKK